MDSGVAVRRADVRNPADVASLAKLRRAWVEEQRGEALDDPDYETAFADWLRSAGEQRTFVVAELDGEAVGMANLTLFHRMPKPATPRSTWCYIANVYVRPGHRGEGVGSSVVDYVLDAARELGCVRAVLAPSEPSRSLYLRAGFRAADELFVHPLDPRLGE